MRSVILHYHLFKNAGTSIDKILKDNFGDKWVTREFTGSNNTDQVTDWILSNPEAIAFSSHTMNGPIPKINNNNIISIAMVRNPIDRIISVYNFERQQKAQTWGAQLAKNATFEEYVLTRLQKNGDEQCRNFQSSRLATLSTLNASQLERAKDAIQKLSHVGLVETFNSSFQQIEQSVTKHFPFFEYKENHSNRSKGNKPKHSETLLQLLNECNSIDLELWKYLKESNQKIIRP